MAWNLSGDVEDGGCRACVSPLLDRSSSDAVHILPRFIGEAGALLQPVGHPFRARVVGRCDQPEVSEASTQFAKKATGGRQGVSRIECIDAELVRHIGHEPVSYT